MPAKGVRPAMARAREALFSMLEARGIDWEGKNILDVFAGSGSLAFEALSRGAARAWLVENGESAIKCLSSNAKDLGLREQCQIVGADAARFLRKTPPVRFDLVFIDPPYRKNLVDIALKALSRGPWLNSGAFVTAEIEKGTVITVPENLHPEAERLFGQTNVAIWRHE